MLMFFRIVETNPPSLYDFMSHQARGRELRFRTARSLRLWDGLSVYRTREDAVAQAGRSPRLGSFVATLAIPGDGTVRYELDNGPHGHCTIWGAPALLMNFVVSVAPVEDVH
jgi:hypothetical protein